MITRRFASTAACLAAAVGVCLLAACGNGAPDGLVANPTTLDFGEVAFRDVLEKKLELTNRGRKPVYVQAITPNCGCIRIPSFLRSIEPGETREIGIVLDSRQLPHVPLKGKVLDVATNPPEARVVVPLAANIVGTHDFAPIFVELEDEAAWAAEHRIELRPRPGVRMEITKVDVVPPALEARIERLDVGADVVVRVRPEAPAGEGRLRGRLRIHVALTLPGGGQRTRVEHVPVEGTWP